MQKTMQKTLLPTSILAGVVTLSTPALAASLNSVNTTGQAIVFGVNSSSITYEVPNTPQNLKDALGGTATAAGGNIELNNTIDSGWSNTTLSTLTATFSDNRSIAFSSLTQGDWFSNGFANTWYTAARSIYSPEFTTLAATLTNTGAQQVYQTAYNQAYTVALNQLGQLAYTTAYNSTPGTVTQKTNAGNVAKNNALNSNTVKAQAAAAAATTANAAKNQFLATNTLDASNTTQMVSALENLKVFQRLSDPNIAYVRGNSGEFTFGLAGHSTVATGLKLQSSDPLYNIFNGIYASEVVKYSLDNGSSWNYAYSFAQPIQSGVVGSDGYSHTGTFEFTVGAREVPESSGVFSLGILGGLLTLGRRWLWQSVQ
jgi:hypothetical protein